jgi:hypothetical protein
MQAITVSRSGGEISQAAVTPRSIGAQEQLDLPLLA